jgi:benzoyl-CoA reductase subunit B
MGKEMTTEGRDERKEWRGEKSTKLMQCSQDATIHQRDYINEMRAKIKSGERMIFGDGPRELFYSMDLQFVPHVFYGSLMAAKQLYNHYKDTLEQQEYYSDGCSYCAQPFGYLLDNNPEIAPWGGLPKPLAIMAEGSYTCDTIMKIFELCAKALNVPYYPISLAHRVNIPPRWWEAQDGDSHMVDQWTKKYEGCAIFLETLTGRSYNPTKLREFLYRGDQSLEIYWKACDLACSTIPAPISVSDVFANVSAYNWHQATEWGLQHAKKFYAEVKERIEKGEAAVPDERVRLMWADTVPIWFSLGFYNYWEKSHGAVFIPRNYFDMAQRVIYYDRFDPLRVLAKRRNLKYTFPSPAATTEYLIYTAKRFQVDGVVAPLNYSCRKPHQAFAAEALERAGIPTLKIVYDPLNAGSWDDVTIKACVTEFIEKITPAAKKRIKKSSGGIR